MEVHCKLQIVGSITGAVTACVTWPNTLTALKFIKWVFQWHSRKFWQKNNRTTFLFSPSPQFNSVPTAGHTWPPGWNSGQAEDKSSQHHLILIPPEPGPSLPTSSCSTFNFYLHEEHILNSFPPWVLELFCFLVFFLIHSQNNPNFATELPSEHFNLTLKIARGIENIKKGKK